MRPGELLPNQSLQSTRRGEGQVDARVAGEPQLNRGMFVRGVVVGDQMPGLTLGDLAINQTKDRQPFLVPRPRQAGGADGALRDIEGGEERGGARARVVVCQRATPALLHGEAWLGAIQRVDRAVLIHAEDHGMLGRVQIQAHHILQLVLEVRSLAEREGPDSVGFQTISRPDPLHERRIRPQVPSPGAGRPVGGARRCRLGRRLQHARDQRLARLGGTPAAWRILGEAGQALGRDAVPPPAHGVPTRVQGDGTVLVVVASAANKASLARSTSRAGVRRPRAHGSSCWRSVSVT